MRQSVDDFVIRRSLRGENEICSGSSPCGSPSNSTLTAVADVIVEVPLTRRNSPQGSPFESLGMRRSQPKNERLRTNQIA